MPKKAGVPIADWLGLFPAVRRLRRWGSPAIGWRRKYVMKEGFRLSKMVARGGVDHDGSVLTIGVDPPHAECVPLETSSDLGGPGSNAQPRAFDFGHDFRRQPSRGR